MYAVHKGHSEAVEAFLPFLQNIATVHCALAWAFEKGKSTVVARLLQHPGVDFNAKVRGDTPIFLADMAMLPLSQPFSTPELTHALYVTTVVMNSIP